MKFVSTEGDTPPVELETALLQGLAPDGGLYMPRSLPSLSGAELRKLRSEAWPEVARRVARRLLETALDPGALDAVVEGALSFPLPLVRLREDLVILELFHGPTLAFKDVGARFMARLMAGARPAEAPPLLVLTATSGDTGGAVAHAFLGLPGIRVVVLFPRGKVTPRQERQFSTLGRNVVAVEVAGDFDDCQRLAKGAFRNQALRHSVRLTSANSINVGRLLPQTLYYFLARSRITGPLLYSVPSGNFGNLAAGLMARKMGLPSVHFLAATNANDEVPEYLRTGCFTPRPSRRTLSTAMDVGRPSNLDRILHLYGHDLERLRKDLTARSVSDAATRRTIRDVREETGYLLDPHSAVGFHALARELTNRPGTTGVLLATAHPAKFAEVVEPVIQEEVPIPPTLARCLEGDRRVTPLEAEPEALEELLRELSAS